MATGMHKLQQPVWTEPEGVHKSTGSSTPFTWFNSMLEAQKYKTACTEYICGT